MSPLSGTRIFYSSIYTLGLWTLFYSGLNGFTNSNIWISWSLPPGEPHDRLLHQKIPKILYSVLSRPCVIAFCIPYHCYILRDNRIHLPVLRSTPFVLLIQDASNCSLLFRESLEPYALQIFAAWIPVRIIPRTYRVSAHSQLFMCFAKDFEIPFDLPEILSSLLLLIFLLACIMVNPISLVIL